MLETASHHFIPFLLAPFCFCLHLLPNQSMCKECEEVFHYVDEGFLASARNLLQEIYLAKWRLHTQTIWLQGKILKWQSTIFWTGSLGALRTLTLSWRPFVLRALWPPSAKNSEKYSGRLGKILVTASWFSLATNFQLNSYLYYLSFIFQKILSSWKFLGSWHANTFRRSLRKVLL